MGGIRPAGDGRKDYGPLGRENDQPLSSPKLIAELKKVQGAIGRVKRSVTIATSAPRPQTTVESEDRDKLQKKSSGFLSGVFRRKKRTIPLPKQADMLVLHNERLQKIIRQCEKGKPTKAKQFKDINESLKTLKNMAKELAPLKNNGDSEIESLYKSTIYCIETLFEFKIQRYKKNFDDIESSLEQNKFSTDITQQIRNLKNIVNETNDSPAPAIQKINTQAKKLIDDLEKYVKAKNIELFTNTLSELDDALFRDKLKGNESTLIKNLQSFVEKSKKTKDPELIIYSNVALTIIGKLKEQDIKREDFVGLIKLNLSVQQLDKTAPQSILTMTRDKFVKGFIYATNTACENILEKVEEKGIFRKAGFRNHQPKILKACFEGNKKALEQYKDVNDWCDTIKAFSRQLVLLNKAGVLTKDNRKPLFKSMKNINMLLIVVENNSEFNKMKKSNIEIATPSIIKALHIFGFKDFEIPEKLLELEKLASQQQPPPT